MKTRVLVAVLMITACPRDGGGPGPGLDDAPPTSVIALTLAPTMVETRNDYVATLTSRRAVTISSQVSGLVRAIAVKAGDQVKAGALLLQVDARPDQATLDNLLATKQSLQASLEYAQERQKRSALLRGDGIVSQQDLDQARVTVEQSQASVQATDALIASQRARLALFTISAPFAGVVGHVPVKVGDFVTPSMPLTSVTQDSGLEAEVWVPAERTTSLTADTRVQVLDEQGQPVAESPVTFVSPRAEPSTQLVLLKGAYDALPTLRPDQAVKARVVWSRHEGLKVPTVSVVRQAGQAFVYVVERADGGAALLAQRVPVKLGDLQGNDYVVLSGLSAGQQVIVSGVQQVGEGRPVQLATAER